LKSKSAAEVVNFIFDTVSTFGCMDTIITDHGREFVNEMNDRLCELLKIRHKTGWIGIRIMWQSEAIFLSADCCFNELALKKSN